ncbi:hypothetical protein RHOSPDRAFT_26731 [Rhodotorula sp. JG-1b]|nr:hypothetical protein RHOSPDRAFT_26731 [Rhodotorula sp. JG-1b]
MSDARPTRGHHGQAFFTQAAKDLRVLLLSLPKGINIPLDQVALHSQLLVHLWVRPFEDSVVRDGKDALNRGRRKQLNFALHKLNERITTALHQDPLATPLQQLRAAARILLTEPQMKQRDSYTFEQCAQAFKWKASKEERADAAGSQRFIEDTITLEDLANVRVPASRTDLPDYRIPEYKIWTNRLLGLISSGTGHLMRRPAHGGINGSKTFKSVSKLSQEDGALLQPGVTFSLKIMRVSRVKSLLANHAVNRTKCPRSTATLVGEQDSGLKSIVNGESSQPKQRKRKRKPSPQSPHSPIGRRQWKRLMPEMPNAPALSPPPSAAHHPLLPVPPWESSALHDPNMFRSGNPPPPEIGPAQKAPQLYYHQPPRTFSPVAQPALAATPYHVSSDQDPYRSGQTQLDDFEPLLSPATNQHVFDPHLLDPTYFDNMPSLNQDPELVNASWQQALQNPPNAGCFDKLRIQLGAGLCPGSPAQLYYKSSLPISTGSACFFRCPKPSAAEDWLHPSLQSAVHPYWTPSDHPSNQSAYYLPEEQQQQQQKLGGPYFHALGHHPRIASRIARKVYRVNPDLWTQRARLSRL